MECGLVLRLIACNVFYSRRRKGMVTTSDLSAEVT